MSGHRVRALLTAGVTALAGAVVACSPDSSPDGPGDAPAGESRVLTYVALGDSFTAAPGVPVTELTSGCARSDGNYPTLVASELGATLVDVSCGGATTAAMTEPQVTELRSAPPQFQALRDDTDLVTVGIGANDTNLFATLFSNCVVVRGQDPDGSPCQDLLSTATGDLLTDSIAATEERLVATLEGVVERSPGATVLLIGYPDVVPAEGTCAALPLATADYAYARSVLTALDEAMHRAAEATDVTFVDLRGATAGRDICAGDRALVNGAVGDPDRAASYHPFPEEQALVADLVTDLVVDRL